MGRIGAAIIGVGRIGQVHLLDMVNSHSIEVFWMVDNESIHPKMEELKTEYNLNETAITSPGDLDKVLNDRRVEMVVICVPTNLHKEVIIRSLKAGKHVFCEKPLCVTVKDVTDCYDEARRQSKVLMCALNRRFDKQFSQVNKLAREGALGEIRTIKMESRDNQMNLSYYENNKGGIFIDMGIHDVDYISWLVDDEPEYCTAIGSRTSTLSEGYERYGEYDTAMGMIKFKKGTLAHVDLCRVTCGGYQQSARILGTKQIAEISNIRESPLQVTDDKGTLQHPFFLVDGFLDRYLDSFAEEMKHFVNVVKGKEECLVTRESVIVSTKLVYMLTEALQTGQKVYWK